MFFTVATLLSFVAVLEATSLTHYPNTGCLSNPLNWPVAAYSCDDLPANVCCEFSEGASSVDWTLPSPARAYASDTETCVQGPWSPVYGPRDDECFDYTNPSINSAWWLASVSKVKRTATAPTGDCVKPNVVIYNNGTSRIRAKIPEGQFDTVKLWADVNDFEKLASLEAV